MTPELKAQEIFDSMYAVIPPHPEGKSHDYDAAKRCSQIAVSQIVVSVEYENVDFWVKVLDEVNTF
jgi:hypothetical protein